MPVATLQRPAFQPHLTLAPQPMPPRGRPGRRRPLLTLDLLDPRSLAAPDQTARPDASSAQPQPSLASFFSHASFGDNTFCSSSASRSSSAASSSSSASSSCRSDGAGAPAAAAAAFADHFACVTPEGRPAVLPRVRRSSFDDDDGHDVASSWSDEMDGFPSAPPPKPSPSEPPAAAEREDRPISRAFAHRSQAIQQVPSAEDVRRGRQGRHP